jgi:hypothetical protein
MMHKIRRILALILAALLLLGAAAPQATACGDLLRRIFGCEAQPVATVALSTPLLGQNRDQWCWAASSLMAARTYVETRVTQTDIVRHVKGTVINEGGTDAERLAAVKFATNGAVEFKVVAPLTQAQMVACIDAGDPIMLCRGWYPDGYPGMRYGGHSTVVYGYQLLDDGAYLFLVRDPWPVNQGTDDVLSYSYIKKGDDTGILEQCEIKK